jgi:glycerol uptake facilitator protein
VSSDHIFIGEIIGTAILILMGAGVCAAVTLKHSKARSAGWLAIAFGWGFGVMGGAYISGSLSGAQLNPAVTIGLAVQSGDWSNVPVYLAGQLIGAMIGAALVWVAYYGQFQAHMNDPELAASVRDSDNPAGPVLGIFSTGPEVRVAWQNLATEILGTFVLVLFICTMGLTKGIATSGIGILLVSLLVVGIGLSLGGPTGYAINPARDLGPRVVHALLPLPNKGGSDWSYAWIPVVGPLIGAVLAGGLYRVAFA